jgi:exonuclease VII large subunit
MQSKKKNNKEEKAHLGKHAWKVNSVDGEVLKIIEEVLQENLEQLLKKKKGLQKGNPIRTFKRKYS